MLDQNTDRMWTVIGAVLIGAALIFGFNAVIPNAFASVGGMMSAQTEALDRRLERYGENLMQDYVIHKHSSGIVDMSLYHRDNIIGLRHTGSTDGLYLKFDDLGLEPETEYVLRYSFEKTDGTLVNIGGHTDGAFRYNTFYLDGVNMSPLYYQLSGDGEPWTGREFMNDDTERHTVEVYFVTPKDFGKVENLYDGRISIQPNRGVELFVEINIYDLELVEVL